jgi:hypothetical protein
MNLNSLAPTQHRYFTKSRAKIFSKKLMSFKICELIDQLVVHVLFGKKLGEAKLKARSESQISILTKT